MAKLKAEKNNQVRYDGLSVKRDMVDPSIGMLDLMLVLPADYEAFELRKLLEQSEEEEEEEGLVSVNAGLDPAWFDNTT